MKLYIVRRGDSLYSIARRFGVTVEQLVHDNQIGDPDRLAVGQTILVSDDAPGGRLGAIEALGYAYPDISAATLGETLPYLSYLCPFTWTVDAEGNLTPPGGEPLKNAAYAADVAPLMSIANLKQDGGFSSEVAHAVLNDPEAQDTFVRNVLTAVNMYHYYGVMMDFEYVYGFDREAYNRLMQRLADVLHPIGALLGSALAPKVREDQAGVLYEGKDYAAHGKIADFVMIMTYEWGYIKGPPMAVSPVDKMRPVLDYAVSVIPPGKILMGMSNYGYNWTLPWRQGDSARLLSNVNAVTLAVQRGAEIMFDEPSQAPWFNYWDAERKKHVVWFEDARSVRARLGLVAEYGLRGIGWWNINQLFRQGLLTYESMFGTDKVLG